SRSNKLRRAKQIPPYRRLASKGSGSESEPDPYYGLGGRFGKPLGEARQRGSQRSLNEWVVKFGRVPIPFWWIVGLTIRPHVATGSTKNRLNFKHVGDDAI